MSYWSEVVNPSPSSYRPTPRHLLAREFDKAQANKKPGETRNSTREETPEEIRMKERGE